MGEQTVMIHIKNVRRFFYSPLEATIIGLF